MSQFDGLTEDEIKELLAKTSASSYRRTSREERSEKYENEKAVRKALKEGRVKRLEDFAQIRRLFPRLAMMRLFLDAQEAALSQNPKAFYGDDQ